MIMKELGTLKRKRTHLDELVNEGTISKFTYTYIQEELEKNMVEAESRQKALIDEMTGKLQEIEARKKELEMAIAQLELKHIAGEIASPFFEEESKILKAAIECTIRELASIRRSLVGIIPHEEDVKKPLEEATPAVETTNMENRTAESTGATYSEAGSETPTKSVLEEPVLTEEDEVATEAIDAAALPDNTKSTESSAAAEESLY